MTMTTPVRPRSRGRTFTLLASLALCLSTSAAIGGPSAEAADPTTYTATITIPVPPASTFAASAGGDGWDVSLSDTQVFNVFHHNFSLQVACHNQTDSSNCWSGPKTITDPGVPTGFRTSGQSGTHFNPATDHLLVYATRASDATGGVVCVDTTAPPSEPNPFCGFTPLTGIGNSTSDGMGISGPVLVGSKWYAFNYYNGADTTAGGGRNQMLCFDMATESPCAGQPYDVALGSGVVSVGTFPAPPIALIGSQVIVPVNIAAGDSLGCFDTATSGSCSGSWPVPTDTGYVGDVGIGNGAGFPLLDAAGTITGVCLPTASVPCYGLDGASAATPPGLVDLFVASGGSTPWNGQAARIGSRVYVPNGNAGGFVGEVACYNYATLAACAGFPKSFTGANYLYTVNPDPQRPSCLWINADFGANQIQNFDAFTGGACDQGAVRVLASSFVVATELCRPTDWQRLSVLDPTPDLYTTGTVAFQDSDAQPIPSVPDQTLDAAGEVDLAPFDLTGSLPQFLLSFDGIAGPQSEVVVRLTWTAMYDESCLGNGATADPPTNRPPTGSAGGPYTGAEGDLIVINGTADDADGDALTTTWSAVPGAGTDPGATCTFGDAGSLMTTITCTDDGTFDLTLTVDDGTSPPVELTTTLDLANVRPDVSILGPADMSVVPTGTTIQLVAEYSDAGGNDQHEYVIDWGDGTTSSGTATGGTITATHVYGATGAVDVTVTVTDDDGGSDSDTIMLVVADAASKVTGGGFVVADGRTSFGFVAKGSAAGFGGQIQVRAPGKSRFHGSTVTSLTTVGNEAAWMGTGSWNGEAGYTFEVRVVDNGNGGGKKKVRDTIELVIRDSAGVIVHSVAGPLKGGNIVVH